MKSFDTTHWMLLMGTVVFVALTMFAVSKLSRKGQNILFAVGAALCALGIFWRYAVGLPNFAAGETWMQYFDALPDLLKNIKWTTLAQEMLQVCNFNFVLVLLMLVPRFELARQYSFMFSMFAAATVMLSIPERFADDAWYSPDFLNFWLNHVLAIALPLWMAAAGRLKPQKKYILPVSACVVGYFLVVYGISEWLMVAGKLTVETSYSYIYRTGGIGLLDLLRKLIDAPLFYLVPLIPFMIGFFWLLTWLFRNSSAGSYAAKKTEDSTD